MSRDRHLVAAFRLLLRLPGDGKVQRILGVVVQQVGPARELVRLIARQSVAGRSAPLRALLERFVHISRTE